MRRALPLLWCLLAGVGLLTYLAKAEDNKNADYVAAVKEADINAKRVQALAQLLLERWNRGVHGRGDGFLLRHVEGGGGARALLES